LDRKALPAPELGAYLRRQYAAPQGEVEEILAGIWQELLHVERVGRNDNFFEMGGHSLLIVQMLERLRRVGLSAQIRRVFDSATLADLANTLTQEVVGQVDVPPNLIPPGCERITPQMLPLVQLEAEHIERIVQSVSDGAANIQDIYPLAPLQEGILFHHVLNPEGGDVYARVVLFSLSSQEHMQRLLQAMQTVIDRHDILRTAVLWEQLPCAVQVVYRQASLPVEEITLQPQRPALEQLEERMQPQRQRLDLRQAPLMRVQIAADPHSVQWYALLQTHHLVCDNGSLDILFGEVMACMEDREQSLPAPVPYRNHVAQTLGQANTQEVEAFFRGKLGEVDEPTAPFGLLDVQGDGSRIESARQALPDVVAREVRLQARRLGVSVATVFHAAWALVMAHTGAREDVVFGSVLLGRLQSSAGAQRILGMFINTLPLRLRLRQVSARELVEQTQRELIELLVHEQASLAVAQRCSGITGSTPLFSGLLNYRHSTVGLHESWPDAAGVRVLASRGGTNYPVVLSVDDTGEGFGLDMQTDRRIDPQRMLGFVCTALQSLVRALEEAPHAAALSLPILPEAERCQVLELFNATQVAYPAALIHGLFEDQVRRTPDAIAVIHEDRSLTYAELNVRANQLAHYLRDRQIGPDQLVGICVERSLEMIVGLLGILKAGGAYVPLDPNYPPERLQCMLQDARPRLLLSQQSLCNRLLPTPTSLVCLDSDWSRIAQESSGNPDVSALGLRSDHLAYVIYTSGSTGQPKGVAIEHRNAVNLIFWARSALSTELLERTLQSTSLNFDLAVYECFVPLSMGASIQVVENAMEVLRSGVEVTLINTVPAAIRAILDVGRIPQATRAVNLAGEALKKEVVELIFQSSEVECVCNLYGPSETTTYSSWISMSRKDGFIPTIGHPIANTQIYILDAYGQPVPIGVAGEIHIGGAGVARGYLNRAELTAERFVADPYNSDPRARLYRTGDLGRWRADGTIEFLGRNDNQVKIRGYRIELGEIESRMLEYSGVREAVVLALALGDREADGKPAARVQSDVLGDKRLVAYYTVAHGADVGVEGLKAHLSRTLASYMVPAAYVMLPVLPLTPSGKLDRKELPAPDGSSYATVEYEAPEGAVEVVLAEIWRALLRVERVGRDDNFFELGGHSLLVLKLILRVAESFDIPLSATAILKHPTVREIAQLVQIAKGSHQEKTPGEAVYEETVI
jgi:amino acid adenylation domain-containing protein